MSPYILIGHSGFSRGLASNGEEFFIHTASEILLDGGAIPSLYHSAEMQRTRCHYAFGYGDIVHCHFVTTTFWREWIIPGLHLESDLVRRIKMALLSRIPRFPTLVYSLPLAIVGIR
jgi:hypothetical protein